jgi:hypothetical protein
MKKSIESYGGLLSTNERCEEAEQYDLFHNKIFCAFKLSIKIVKLVLCFRKVIIFILIKPFYKNENHLKTQMALIQNQTVIK